MYAPTLVNISTYLSYSPCPQRGKERAKRRCSRPRAASRLRGEGPARWAGRGSERPWPLPAPPGAHRRRRASAPCCLTGQRRAGRAGQPRGPGKRKGKAALSCAGTCRAAAGAPAAAQGEVEAGRGAQHRPAGSGGAERSGLPRPAGSGRAAQAAAAEPRGRSCGDGVRGDAAMFPPRHSNPGTAPPGRVGAARPSAAAGRLLCPRLGAAAPLPAPETGAGKGQERRRLRVVDARRVFPQPTGYAAAASVIRVVRVKEN